MFSFYSRGEDQRTFMSAGLEFESQFQQLLSVWTWEQVTETVCSGFLICKMGIITPISQGCFKNWMSNEPNKPSIVSGFIFIVSTQRMIAIHYYNTIITIKRVWGWVRLCLIFLPALGFDGPLAISICTISVGKMIFTVWSQNEVQSLSGIQM